MKSTYGIALAAALLIGGQALAQSTGTTSGNTSSPTTGTTSGPATGNPTTLGAGGQAPVTQHQAETLRNHGGPAMSNERPTGGPTGLGNSTTGTTQQKPQ